MRGTFILLLALVAPLGSLFCDDASFGDDDLALLKTFRQEFVNLTRGQGKFPAEFEMGRAGGESVERPVHRVTLKRPFAIARYEVPQNLWQAVMGSNPSRWKG